MLAEKNIVNKLIPQGSPMLMVDSLLEHEGYRTLSGFTIGDENIFVERNKFTEAGIIENMAQTAALHTGWLAMNERDVDEGFKPPIGVIGSVKNFKLFRLPEVNSLLETEIIIQTEIFNATVVNARTRSGKEILAEAELKIFII